MTKHWKIAKELRLRPLFCGCVSAYLGAWIINTLSTDSGAWRPLCGAVAAVTAVICITVQLRRRIHQRKKKRRNPSLLPVLAAVLLGCAAACFLTAAEDARQAHYDGMHGREAEIIGIVTDTVWASDRSGCYTVHVTEVDGTPAAFPITMEVDRALAPGDGIRSTVRFLAPGAEDGDAADTRNYSLAKGIRLEAVCLDVSAADVAAPLPIRIRLWGTHVQRTLSRVLTDTLGEAEGGLAASLFLGNRAGLPDTVYRDFTRLGIAHILALSGMHLAVVTDAAGILGRKLGRRWGRVLSAIAALFYMTVTGFSASVTRAGIMLLLCLLLKSIGKGSDSFTNLGIAVCTILLCSAGASRDASLLLSFCGVLAMLLFAQARRTPFSKAVPKRGVLRRLCRRVWELLLLSFCAVLFLLPLTCVFFGKVSLLTPLACILFTPLAALLLWLLPAFLLLSPIPPLASLLAPAVRLLLCSMIVLAAKLSALPNICVSLRFPIAPLLCAAVFVSVLWTLIAARDKRRIPLLCLFLTVAVLFGCVIYNRMERRTQVTATMLNSDTVTLDAQNDGILVTSGRDALLIDISIGGYSLPRACVAAAKERQCTEIRAVLLTHLHMYHPATLERLWSREMVREVWLPEEDSDVARSIRKGAAAAGVQVITYTPGDVLKFGEAQIVTYPYGNLPRSTHPVLRVDVAAAGERLVYLGSAYGETFPFAEFSETPAKVLWFGAHGPKYHLIPDVSLYSAAESYFVTGDACQISAPEPLSPNYIVFGEE